MVTAMVYKHDRNNLLIGDFHDPKTGLPMTAIVFRGHAIIYSDAISDLGIAEYEDDVITTTVYDVLNIISEYTKEDVCYDDGSDHIRICRVD